MQLAGIDRVNSKLADCIKIAESTPQNKEPKSGGGICGGSGETNPRLVWMGPSISGYLRALHQNLLTFGLPNQLSPRSIRTLITS